MKRNITLHDFGSYPSSTNDFVQALYILWESRETWKSCCNAKLNNSKITVYQYNHLSNCPPVLNHSVWGWLGLERGFLCRSLILLLTAPLWIQTVPKMLKTLAYNSTTNILIQTKTVWLGRNVYSNLIASINKSLTLRNWWFFHRRIGLSVANKLNWKISNQL